MHAAPPTIIAAPPPVATPVAATPATPASAFVALVVANVALAFGAWFVRLADTGPVAAAFWRMAIALPFLIALALASGARPQRLDRGLWLMLAAGGVAFALDLGTWHLGILRTTLANATLFGNSATLIFPIYGFLIARAWPNRIQAVALALAFAGAALLMGRSYQLDPRNLAGDLLCVLAGLLYTLYFVLMARVRTTMAPLPALTLSSLASVGPLLIFSLLLGERVVPGNWTPLIGLALVSQLIGQGCMIYALGKASPLVVGIALLVQPVVAGTIGWVLYGERLHGPDFIGVVLVCLALVLVRRGDTVARPVVAPAAREAQERS
jgi:drug/metabolite transporter (DMT)-like permease